MKVPPDLVPQKVVAESYRLSVGRVSQICKRVAEYLKGGEPEDPGPIEAARESRLIERELVAQKIYLREFAMEAMRQGAAEQVTTKRFKRDEQGRVLKEKLAKLSPAVPLLPPFDPKDFRAPITPGPYAGTDEEGYPWVDEVTRDVVMDRMGLMSRRKQLPEPAGPEAAAMMETMQMRGRPARPAETTPMVK